MFRSLFARLMSSYLVVILGTLLLLGILTSVLFASYYYSTQEKQLVNRGKELAALMHDYLNRGRPIEEVMDVTSCLIDAQVVWVGSDVLNFAGHGRLRRLWLEPRDVEQIMRGEVISKKGFVPRYDQIMLLVAVPVENNGTVSGALLLSTPLADITNTITAVRKLILMAAIPTILFAAALGFLLSRSVSRPLRDMSAAARAMAGGNFDKRVKVSSRDEVGELAQSFNHLAGALQKTVQNLSREKEKLESVLANMAEGVIAVDDRCRIIAANRQARESFNLSGEVFHLLLEETPLPAEAKELFKQVLQTRQPKNEEITLGKKILLALVSPLQEKDRQVFGAVGVFHDITDIRRLEQMRRDLLANVSHELRTPLTSVQGFVEAILDGTITDEEGKLASLQTIHRETMRLNRLVHDLLDLAAMESGKISWEIHQVQVNELIDRVVTKLQPQLDQKQLQVQKEIPGDLPPVLANEDRAEQVLTNLLSNAIQFSPRGEVITVTAKPGDEEVTVSVADHGPGIPAEELSSVWERFHRVEKSRSRSLGGTGLGLAITRQIVETHGGKVQAESEPGQGSIFSFTLPAARKKEQHG